MSNNKDTKVFIIGGLIGVATLYLFKRPSVLLWLIIGGFAIAGLGWTYESIQSARAKGLEVTLVRVDNTNDADGIGRVIAVARVVNNTGRTVANFDAKCGDHRLSDYTGMLKGVNEERGYEVGIGEGGACYVADVSFGPARRFTGSRTYSRYW